MGLTPPAVSCGVDALAKEPAPIDVEDAQLMFDSTFNM